MADNNFKIWTLGYIEIATIDNIIFAISIIDWVIETIYTFLSAFNRVLAVKEKQYWIKDVIDKIWHLSNILNISSVKYFLSL